MTQEELLELARRPIPHERPGEYPLAQETGEPLVDLTDRSPRVVYGGEYLRRGLPGALSRCLLREEAADRLLTLAEELPVGYGFYIFDTLRPVTVQQALYDGFLEELRRREPDLSSEELARRADDFVALPRVSYDRPAPHTTGGAVDLTLTFRGAPLEMGTGFDDFSPRAQTRWLEEDPHPTDREARGHRRMLYHLMAGAGFANYAGEWWHYSYGDRAWARATGRPPRYSYITWEDRR